MKTAKIDDHWPVKINTASLSRILQYTYTYIFSVLYPEGPVGTSTNEVGEVSFGLL